MRALSLSKINRGTWVAQSVEHPTSAQVMISQFASLSPVSGSVLMAQSLELASDSVSLYLSCAGALKMNKQTLKKYSRIETKPDQHFINFQNASHPS